MNLEIGLFCLRRYFCENTITQLLLPKQAEDIEEQQIAELKEAFSLFDEDNSGTITVEELSKVMEALGLQTSDEELEEMVLEVDVDQSGILSDKILADNIAENLS